MESPFRDPIPAGTRLIETFGFRVGQGIARQDLHLARLERSARALGFALDIDAARAKLDAIDCDMDLRCRLTLEADGTIEIQTVQLPPAPTTPWRFQIAPQVLSSNDPWLRHKTTQRAAYDEARANLPKDIDELVFVNERGEICEGSITNIAITTAEGQHLTPPLSSGCLSGVYRQSQLDAGLWREAVLTLHDLKSASRIVLANSLRGEIEARLSEE